MGHPIWFIYWFLAFWVLSFTVAVFSAFCYIILYLLEMFFLGLADINNYLLKGIQFPRYCAEGMRDCRTPF